MLPPNPRRPNHQCQEPSEIRPRRVSEEGAVLLLWRYFPIKEVGIISVPCTLTLTDLEVTWLERVINNVVNDPSSNSNLRAEAEKLRRKLRDAQEDAVMESNRRDSWDEA